MDKHELDGILTDYPNRLAMLLSGSHFEKVFGDRTYLPKDINGQIYIKNGSVSVFKGYGDNNQYSGVRLRKDTLCKFMKIAVKNGTSWYCIGDDLWLNGDFTSYDKLDKPVTPRFRSGLVRTVKSAPVYGDENCQDRSNRELRNNSQWNYFAVYQKAGHSAYNLGGNQWIRAQDVKVLS